MFKITVEEILGEGDDITVDIVYQQLTTDINLSEIIKAVNYENGKEDIE